MEVLVHFIFELVKISIFACVYSSVVLFTFRITSVIKPNGLIDRVSKTKLKFWLLCGKIISAGLFVFMFTYWGNHGLGDNATIPIGHFKTVDGINSTDSFIENNKGKQLNIKNFAFDKDYLYAETETSEGTTDNYVIWNLKTGNWVIYNTIDNYLNEAKFKHFPHPDQFQDFWKYYNQYWSGWRFWLLP